MTRMIMDTEVFTFTKYSTFVCDIYCISILTNSEVVIVLSPYSFTNKLANERTFFFRCLDSVIILVQ